MPDLSLLETIGAQPAKPTRFRPLSTQRFFSGLWTQRGPFQGADNRYYTRFLGNRTDILIDGLNTEISNYGTLIRRPGFLEFKPGMTLSGQILSFYNFRQVVSNANLANPVDIIADTATNVYKIDAISGATSIFTKTPGAGQNFFQGVGATLYMSNTLDTPLAWVDPSSTAPGPGLRNWGIAIGLFAGANGPLAVGAGSDRAVTGGTVWNNPNNITTNVSSASVILGAGSAANTAGPSGGGTSSQTSGSYAWANTDNILTHDGSYATAILPVPPGNTPSSSILASNFGFNLPANATINGVSMTVYRNQLLGTSAVYDSVITLAGVPGAANRGNGATNDWGSVNTFTYGNSVDTWGATLTPSLINSSAFGASISCQCTGGPGNGATAGVDYATITVFYTTPSSNISDILLGTNFGFALASNGSVGGIQVQITGSQSVVVAGSSISVQLLQNGQPVGSPKAALLPGSTGTITLGANNDLWNTMWATTDFNSTTFGVSIQALNSSGVPITFNVSYVQVTVWATGGPSVTVDVGAGALSAKNGGYKYVVAYGNSNAGPGVNTSGHVSSTTPSSQSTGNFSNQLGVDITVVASTDPQVNQIWIFRTTDGGSLYYALPQQYPNTSGTIVDSYPDSSLVIEQQAPLYPQNNTPPAGILKLTYHVGRVWGAIGNVVSFSAGPDCILGNGSEAWPPANVFVFPSTVNRLVPTSNGLLVFTATDLWLIIGTGIATFYPVLYTQGLGLLSYNALDLEGSNIFLFTADRQFITLSAAGVNEIGYAIGNLLETNFSPTSSYVASLISGTRDKAVFVSDGSASWYRCNWNQFPEAVPSWSPIATIFNGITAMASIETSPGQNSLMIGQPNGKVLVRAIDTFTDNGFTYTGYATFGSLVLAQPGQLAEVDSITVELPNIGTVPNVSVLLDEIDPTYFEALPISVIDPPMLVPSNSVMSRRFYLLQGNQAVVCRHMQIKIEFNAETFRNELYTLSIWGALQASGG